MRFNMMDNVVVRALSKLGDMICLNVMWLVCCIPVVTIGASTTALYTVMLKLVKNEEGYVFRGFLQRAERGEDQHAVNGSEDCIGLRKKTFLCPVVYKKASGNP